MTQSRLESLIETVINTCLGFIINYCANLVILPLFGFHITPGANFLMGLLYTVISVARSYAVRRWFNARLRRLAAAVATSIEARP